MRVIQRLIIIVLLVSAVACTKDEDPVADPPDRGPIATSLQNLVFDEGSYWIYKNLAESSIDSVAVNNTVVQWLYLSGGPGAGVQTILQEVSMTFSSTRYDSYTIYGAYNILAEGKMSGGVVYIGGANVGDSILNASVADLHDTITINGEVYTNVVEMHINNDDYINNDMNLYYSDSIGVIRKEIKDSTSVVETWDLIRYSVRIYDIE